MQVIGLCKSAVVTVRRQDELMVAARLMRDRHVGFLIVVQPKARTTGERVVGVLTDRDVMVSVIASEVDPHALKVDDVMTQSPITVNQEASLEKALQLMSDAGVRRLPVVDDAGGLKGVLAMDDIIAWLGEITEMINVAIRKELTVERKLRVPVGARRSA
jgi:CBS domain-containing protein